MQHEVAYKPKSSCINVVIYNHKPTDCEVLYNMQLNYMIIRKQAICIDIKVAVTIGFYHKEILSLDAYNYFAHELHAAKSCNLTSLCLLYQKRSSWHSQKSHDYNLS